MKRNVFVLTVALGLLTWTGSPAQALVCSYQSVAGFYTFVLAGGSTGTVASFLGVITLNASGAISGTVVSSEPGQPGNRDDFGGSWVLEGPGTANCFLTIFPSGAPGLTGRMVSPDMILISVVFDPSVQLAGIMWRQQ